MRNGTEPKVNGNKIQLGFNEKVKLQDRLNYIYRGVICATLYFPYIYMYI